MSVSHNFSRRVLSGQTAEHQLNVLLHKVRAMQLMPQSAYNQSYTLCAIFKDCNDVLYSLGNFKDVP